MSQSFLVTSQASTHHVTLEVISTPSCVDDSSGFAGELTDLKFNDDIQGTGAVTVSVMISLSRSNRQHNSLRPYRQQSESQKARQSVNLCILGIAYQIVD